jgi:hypothetical protein
MSVYDEFTAFVKKAGITIHPANADLALSREDLLVGLRLLEASSVWILGGDVLVAEGNQLRYLGEGWHFDTLLEGNGVNESVESAIDFVTN